MVQEGRRNATSNVWDVGEAVVRQISFVCRTRGDRALTSTRLHCTGGGASDRTCGVNDLAGAAAQRRHPQRRFGVSRVDYAMARRFLRQPQSPMTPNAAAKSGRLAGRGTGVSPSRSVRVTCGVKVALKPP